MHVFVLTQIFFVINHILDIIWCCVPSYNMFSHRIHSQQCFWLSLFNQNSLSLIKKRYIHFSMEVWSSYLIKYILFWMLSLTSCLGIKSLQKIFKSSITFFVWWILEMLENSCKNRAWWYQVAFLWYRPQTIFCQGLTFFCVSF